MAVIKGALLALDVGEKRTGVAVAASNSGFARPFRTLNNPEAFFDDIKSIITSENITELIVGLPQNTKAEDTVQTKYIRQFAAKLETLIDIPISFHDEAGSSYLAEQELIARKKNYTKADIDSLAATYILQSYIDEKLGVRT